MALTQSKRKFLNHCKSLVLNPLNKCPTFLEFFNSLPGDNSEVSQGTCIDMLNSIEFVPESDLLFDPEVDKFAQLFINMAAGKDAPRAELESDEEAAAAKEAMATQQASEEPKKAKKEQAAEPEVKQEAPKAKKEPKKAQSEEPKAKKARKASTRKPWSSVVDKFINLAGITDEATIAALRSEEVAALYKGKQHCYVYIACRCKLLDLYRSTGNNDYMAWALVKSNKSTLDSIKKVNWFNVADLV